MEDIGSILGIAILAGFAFPHLIRLRPAFFVALATYLLMLLLILALTPFGWHDGVRMGFMSVRAALFFLLQVFTFYQLVVAYSGLTTPGIFREIGLGFGWLTSSDKKGFPVNPPPPSSESPTIPPSSPGR